MSQTAVRASIRINGQVEELSVHTPDLDDVFLTLTGRPDAGHVEQQKEAVR